MTVVESTKSCFFLGAGIHTCLGKTVAENLSGLKLPPPVKTHLTCHLGDQAITVPYFTLSGSLPDGSEQRLFDTLHTVITHALSEANLNSEQQRQMGVFLGSSSFDIAITEKTFSTTLKNGPHSQTIPLMNPSFANLAQKIIHHFDIRGIDYSFNTACTSSVNALLSAKKHIDAGIIKHALIIGVELHNHVTALGFNGLGLISQTEMKPFQDTMDGLILGEGVSALVIGSIADQKPIFRLLGGRSQSDTYSMSASNPDGSSMASVMRNALQTTGVSHQQIQAIKTHATACQSNDAAEAAAMHTLFESMPPLCALKPHIGHTLGACGLNELILFYKALESGFLISTPTDQENLGELNLTLNDRPTPVQPGHFMLNYFGFGGNNTSIIISNEGQHH